MSAERYDLQCTSKGKAKIKYLGLQKGDTHKTHASIKKLENAINYKPKVGIEEGIKNFVDWYKKYYKK